MPTTEDITSMRRERLKQLFLEFRAQVKHLSDQQLLLQYAQVDPEKEPYKREFIKREVGFYRNYQLRTNDELRETLDHLLDRAYDAAQKPEAKYDFDWLDVELMVPLLNDELYVRQTRKKKPNRGLKNLVKSVLKKSMLA